MIRAGHCWHYTGGHMGWGGEEDCKAEMVCCCCGEKRILPLVLQEEHGPYKPPFVTTFCATGDDELVCSVLSEEATRELSGG